MMFIRWGGGLCTLGYRPLAKIRWAKIRWAKNKVGRFNLAARIFEGLATLIT